MSTRRSVSLLALGALLLLASLSLSLASTRELHRRLARPHHKARSFLGVSHKTRHLHRHPTPHRNLSPVQQQQVEASVTEDAVEGHAAPDAASQQEEDQAAEDTGKLGVDAAVGDEASGANCHYYSVQQTDTSDYFSNTNDDRCPVLELLKCKACTAHPKCVWDQSTLQCALASSPRKHQFFSTDCSYINTDKHSFVHSQELTRLTSTIKRDHLDTLFFLSVALHLNKAQIEDLLHGFDLRLPELKREEVLKKYTDRLDLNLRDALALQFDRLNPADALVSRMQLLTHVLRVVDQYKLENEAEENQPTLHESRQEQSQEEAERDEIDAARKEIDHIQQDDVKKHLIEPRQERPNVPANPHRGTSSVVDAEENALGN